MGILKQLLHTYYLFL